MYSGTTITSPKPTNSSFLPPGLSLRQWQTLGRQQPRHKSANLADDDDGFEEKPNGDERGYRTRLLRPHAAPYLLPFNKQRPLPVAASPTNTKGTHCNGENVTR